jgi:hypothetical protein
MYCILYCDQDHQIHSCSVKNEDRKVEKYFDTRTFINTSSPSHLILYRCHKIYLDIN